MAAAAGVLDPHANAMPRVREVHESMRSVVESAAVKKAFPGAFDVLWYVIEGEFRFKAGDAMLRASTGGMVFGPRGTPHCFQNIGDTPGRLLVITTPSALERFFEDWATLRAGQPSPEAPAAVGHASWIEFVGPPAAVSDPL